MNETTAGPGQAGGGQRVDQKRAEGGQGESAVFGADIALEQQLSAYTPHVLSQVRGYVLSHPGLARAGPGAT
ncbi:hypothetical protein ACFCZ1_22005 [Streptomyces sp. NPDC056224]|uniref:hypothetical protein n=1 Tax=Streptomyces sp. NPDC056224 TaxID=3345750 RepID=UPI0035DE6388